MAYYKINYRKINNDGTFELFDTEIESVDLITAAQKIICENEGAEIYKISKII